MPQRERFASICGDVGMMAAVAMVTKVMRWRMSLGRLLLRGNSCIVVEEWAIFAEALEGGVED